MEPGVEPTSSDAGLAEGPARRRWRPPLGVAAALTLVVIALPFLSASWAYSSHGQLIDQDFVAAATVGVAVLCGGAWCWLLVRRVQARTPKAASGATGDVVIRDAAIVRALLEQHEVACGNCGYSLRGLQGSDCPECREPIRLELGGQGRLRWMGAAAWLGLGACAARTVVSGSFLLSMLGRGRFFGLPPGYRARFIAATVASGVQILGAIVVAFLAMVWWRAASGPARRAARWRVVVASVCSLALAEVANLVAQLLWWV